MYLHAHAHTCTRTHARAPAGAIYDVIFPDYERTGALRTTASYIAALTIKVTDPSEPGGRAGGRPRRGLPVSALRAVQHLPMHISVNLLPALVFRPKHVLAAPLSALASIVKNALRSSAWLAVLCSSGWCDSLAQG
jgi:hypothetical protein